MPNMTGVLKIFNTRSMKSCKRRVNLFIGSTGWSKKSQNTCKKFMPILDSETE